MKNMKKYLLGALLTISVAGVQAADQKSKDIVDVAVGAGSFKTLVAAVKAAALTTTTPTLDAPAGSIVAPTHDLRPRALNLVTQSAIPNGGGWGSGGVGGAGGGSEK